MDHHIEIVNKEGDYRLVVLHVTTTFQILSSVGYGCKRAFSKAERQQKRKEVFRLYKREYELQGIHLVFLTRSWLDSYKTFLKKASLFRVMKKVLLISFNLSFQHI